MNQHAELIKQGRHAAEEIAAEGHAGWGNVLTDLADALQAERAAVPDIEGAAEARAIAIYEAVHNEVGKRIPWTCLRPMDWEPWRRAANITQPASAKPQPLTACSAESKDIDKLI